MECFSHPSSQAVGVCKGCGKAICRACAKDLGFAVACSDACAAESTDVHEMNQRGKKLYGIGVAKNKIPSGVIMWILFGLLFGGFGVLNSFRNGQAEWFILVFSATSFVVAFIAYRRAKEVGLQC
jgi:NAD(P)-dependent dehydrogenase (short-subunit alcohol dehydrogenase family)